MRERSHWGFITLTAAGLQADLISMVEKMEQVESLIASGHLDQAREALEQARATGENDARWHYLHGLIAEKRGDAEGAIGAYQRALSLDPANERAMFRLAYNLDLRGEDAEAIRLYKECVELTPTHVSALMNLAVLYEDYDDFDGAEQCLKDVLATYPNHSRARLFLKDVQSSMDMYYDEDQDRTRERHNALVDIPVTDFELSVRSRNCLKKMNINTLGDLLRVTEAELLAYKNFGETSLHEIKVMLSQKGLRLGQALEDPQLAAAAAPAPPRRQLPQAPPEVLNKPVAELELSVRSRKCLQRLNINTLGDLAMRTEAELLGTKNFGQTSLAEIKERLTQFNLSLRRPES
jgi:DNA-directed RNA polymerase subunit alpha